MRQIRILSSTISSAILLLAAASPAPAQSPWFPLEPGWRWSYVNETRPENTQEVSVKRLQGDLIVVEISGSEVLLSVTQDGAVDIYDEESGERVPYYRFEEDSWTHHDVHSCDDDRVMTVVARDETVRTPAGEFSGCLKIEYGASRCIDGGTYEEWWAPGVGRVKWSDSTFGGPRTFVLAEYASTTPPSTFRRGDVNDDGAGDLSDPISILGWLFQGGAAPSCQDAADANDDSTIDLSDAIGLLTFLFLEGQAPPAPGPVECGEDPTADDLPACDSPSCSAPTFTLE